jgi:hypothetical protein
MSSHQDTNRLADWVAETPASIAARLEGAKSSQTQIRVTIGVMALVSMMMLLVSYKAYISYDYEWVIAQGDRQLDQTKVADVLTTQALKDWASSRNVTISLLGINVSADDAPVLGAAVLFILSLWLLLLARRENHIIGFLLRDTDTPRPDSNRDPSVTRSTESQRKIFSSGERWLIFHTIISNSIFGTCDHSLASVRSLDGPNPLKASATTGLKGWLNRVGFGFVRSFFFFFPVVAAITVFCLDRWSYFIRDPFELHAAIPNITETERFYWVSMAVFFVCWILLTVCCWRSSQYSRITDKLLRDYRRKLVTDLVQGNGVLDKPKYEQTESREQQITASAKRRYVVALLFACIFIASTTILLGGVSGVFHSTSDTSTWVAVFTSIVSAIGTISTTILAWKNDRRESRGRRKLKSRR